MACTRRAILAAALLLPTAASAQGTPAPKDAYLYFISPQDGDVLKGAFRVRFGLRNMGITHAGDNFPNSGHHHLLIDVDEPINPGEPIPQDKKHLHYGGGESEAQIELPPGKHTLQLVFGDGNHFNFDPPLVSEKITITVISEDEPRKSAHAVRSGSARIRHHKSTPGQGKSVDQGPPATQKPAEDTGFFSRFINRSK